MAAKLPRDSNQLAKYILEVTTGETEKIEPSKKNAAAVALAALGASKGGKARAKSLSKKRKKEIAEKGAKARWGSKKKRKV
jgi:hypothetical protein